MKANKKAISLVLGAALAAGLSVSSFAAEYKIGMSFQELNNPYFVTMQQAL